MRKETKPSRYSYEPINFYFFICLFFYALIILNRYKHFPSSGPRYELGFDVNKMLFKKIVHVNKRFFESKHLIDAILQQIIA